MEPFYFSRFWPLLAPLLNAGCRPPARELLITSVTTEPQQAERGTLLFWSAASAAAGTAALAAVRTDTFAANRVLPATSTSAAAAASITPETTAAAASSVRQWPQPAAADLIIITDILNAAELPAAFNSLALPNRRKFCQSADHNYCQPGSHVRHPGSHRNCQPTGSQPGLIPLILPTAKLSSCYWHFIAFYRRRFTLPVVGVSGTCGKTTVIEMIRTITAQQQPSQPPPAPGTAGRRSRLPITPPPDYVFTDTGRNLLKENLPYLLRIDQHTRAAVLELGVTHPGCISHSCRYFKPDIGVLLNIGVYHLQGCGTLARYLQAKTELLSALPAAGSIIYNADDPLIRQLDWRKCRARPVAISGQPFRSDTPAARPIQPAAYYQLTNVQARKSGLSFTIRENGKSPRTLSLPVLGSHNAVNATAAAICCRLLGLGWPAITNGLQHYRPAAHHLQLKNSPQGWYILDDSWNCTPPAMLAALQTLNELALELNARSIALLGEMPNLGAAGSNQYQQIGHKIGRDNSCDELLLLGQQVQAIGAAAQAGGFPAAHIHYCRTARQVADWLQIISQPADTVKQTAAAEPGNSPPLLPVSRPLIILLKIPYSFSLRQQAEWQQFMQCLGLES